MYAWSIGDEILQGTACCGHDLQQYTDICKLKMVPKLDTGILEVGRLCTQTQRKTQFVLRSATNWYDLETSLSNKLTESWKFHIVYLHLPTREFSCAYRRLVTRGLGEHGIATFKLWIVTIRRNAETIWSTFHMPTNYAMYFASPGQRFEDSRLGICKPWQSLTRLGSSSWGNLLVVSSQMSKFMQMFAFICT